MQSSRRPKAKRPLPCMENILEHRIARTALRDGREVLEGEPPGFTNIKYLGVGAPLLPQAAAVMQNGVSRDSYPTRQRAICGTACFAPGPTVTKSNIDGVSTGRKTRNPILQGIGLRAGRASH